LQIFGNILQLREFLSKKEELWVVGKRGIKFVRRRAVKLYYSKLAHRVYLDLLSGTASNFGASLSLSIYTYFCK
jgi:hypothetical protein